MLDCGAQAAGVACCRAVARRPLGVRLAEVVPGAATVLVVAANPEHLQRFLGSLDELEPAAAEQTSGDVVEIACRYDGPDLAEVAAATGLSVAEVDRAAQRRDV